MIEMKDIIKIIKLKIKNMKDLEPILDKIEEKFSSKESEYVYVKLERGLAESIFPEGIIKIAPADKKDTIWRAFDKALHPIKKYWKCSCCGEEIKDEEEAEKHVLDKHLEKLSLKLKDSESETLLEMLSNQKLLSFMEKTKLLTAITVID